MYLQAEIKLDDEGAMEVVSDNEEGEGEEEGDTQFHVDMEQELAEPPLATPQTTGEASNSNSNQPATDGDDNRHGDKAPPPHLGPCYCVRQVMRNDMSESLDILMRVLQCHAHSTSFHNGERKGGERGWEVGDTVVGRLLYQGCVCCTA